jgi:GNAT superfamily N-acetyltransferase
MQTEENRNESLDEVSSAESSESSDSFHSPDAADSHLEIEISASYPPEVKRDLAAGDDDPSHTHDYKLSWRPTETHIFVSVEGRKMSHVGLVRQTVEVCGASLEVAGIGGVLVRDGERGHGYGRAAMDAAEAYVGREMKIGFALLFCREAVRSWYDAHGWRKVLGATWAEQPSGSIVLPLASMWKSLSGARWPDGDVYLHSRPW